MSNKIGILITIMIVFGIGLITFIPIFIISTTLSPYGIIDEKIFFYCTQNNVSAIEELNLNVDAGNIHINYIDPQVDYAVKIDVNFEMIGSGLAGKSYNDYFMVKWQNSSSALNFTMKLLSDSWLDSSIWILKNVDIDIFVRMDTTLDIFTTVKNGDFEILVPWGVSTGNIFTNVTNGDIFYDFYHCTIGSSITGITKDGNIRLDSYNLIYTQNSNWILNSEVGNMVIDIYQENEMGANITGTGITKTGIISIIYNDYSPNVGAQFVLFNKTTHGAEGQNTWIGFERDTLPLLAGQFFYSKDFPTQKNYNFSFFKWDGGDYIWNLYSIPT